ncbi:MAG: c-type cytochrome, partial [Dehalococcoidia bacterium]
MNTSKQVNVMIGLMFIFLVGTLLYFVWDDIRAEDALEKQIVENAERGGGLFSLNCRACHGISGLGTLENPNLPGLPLNVAGLNRPTDPETMLPELGELMIRQNRIRDTIRCGRAGTLMPQWAEDQGGALNDFQIDQLVALITGAMPGLDPPDNLNAVSEQGWEAAVEEADHADIIEGKTLALDAGPADTVLVLTDAQALNVDSLLRLDDEVVLVRDAPARGNLQEQVTEEETELPLEDAGDLFRSGDIVQVDKERMRVVSASDDTVRVERAVDGTEAKGHRVKAPVFEPGDEIVVDRGAFNTEAVQHDAGAQVYAGPIEPPTGPLIGANGVAPCGQRGVAPAAASPGPAPSPVPIDGEVTIEMGDNFFSLDGQSPPTLQVAVGQEVNVNLTNNGIAIHNMHVAGSDNTYDVNFCEAGGEEACSDPGVMMAGDTGTVSFQFDEAGTFNFRCDFHPIEM